MRLVLRAALLLLLLCLLVPGVLSQDDRTLVPGVSVDSSLSAETPAQVFTYAATTEESVKLTVISGDGLALGILATDAAANPIGQARDERANGFLVLDNLTLPTAGTYYITVFPLAIADVPTEGAFSLSLAQASNTAGAAQPTPNPDDEATPTNTPDQAVDETVVITPTPSTEASVVDAVAPSQILTSAGIEVSLTWNATVDLNLEVRGPNGGTVFWDNPTTESGGAFQGFNVNGACETFTADTPTETVAWPPGAVPTGSYEILVFYVQDCETNGAVPFTINIVVDGEPLDPISGTTLPNQVFIASFSLADDGTVAIRESGVDQGLLPAPAAEITAAAQSITRDTPTEGIITAEQPFQAFTLQADAGDVLSVSMDATSGNLDGFLFLINSSGNIVAQNDDANAATRNAALNGVLINETDTYTLVATRYGQRIGGTEGNYTLLVIGANAVGASTSEALLGVDLPDGLIETSLIWDTNADLQLLIRDPLGDAVFDDQPLIPSGGTLAADGNVGCTVAEGTPYYYTYWPAGLQLRPGTYEIDVWYQNDCGDTTPVNPTLTVEIGGQVIISDTFTPRLRDHYITTFTIGLDGSVRRGPGGIAAGSETIEYLPDLPNAPALTSDVPIQGTITDDNRFDVYTFDGTANDTINLRMNATAGTLDTLLFLIGPTGIELATNDDAIPNETTDSAITEFTLPQTGQYIVLATHYGTIYGGTNGAYTLQFSRLNTP
jgi:hypothetical protein